MSIEAIIDNAREGIEQLAKNLFQEFILQAEQDFDDFALDTKTKLEIWANAAANGQLSKDELAFLIKMRIDVTEMHALTGLGIAQAKLEKFRKGVISLLVKSVMAAV